MKKIHDTARLTTAELYEVAAFLRGAIGGLIAKGSNRSVRQDDALREYRAEMRRVRAELKKRVTQLPLF